MDESETPRSYAFPSIWTAPLIYVLRRQELKPDPEALELRYERFREAVAWEWGQSNRDPSTPEPSCASKSTKVYRTLSRLPEMATQPSSIPKTP